MHRYNICPPLSTGLLEKGGDGLHEQQADFMKYHDFVTIIDRDVRLRSPQKQLTIYSRYQVREIFFLLYINSKSNIGESSVVSVEK